MPKIRKATQSDMSELLRMGEAFFNASGYSDITSINLSDTESLLSSLIDQGTILTDGKNAMIGFVIFPMFLNNETMVSQELFWWVDEEKRNTRVGIEILKEAEKTSKAMGAKVMMMLSIKELNGDKVNRIYQRMGYTEREQTYMRVL